jgi:hypothetical protein
MYLQKKKNENSRMFLDLLLNNSNICERIIFQIVNAFNK